VVKASYTCKGASRSIGSSGAGCDSCLLADVAKIEPRRCRRAGASGFFFAMIVVMVMVGGAGIEPATFPV
jgi:hypothetical protein